MSETILYQKRIENRGHYDVVVLGGGPSGVCAAIGARRNGGNRRAGADSAVPGAGGAIAQNAA